MNYVSILLPVCGLILFYTVCRDIMDTREQGEYLRANRVDVLINRVGTWTYANDSVILSQLFGVTVTGGAGNYFVGEWG